MYFIFIPQNPRSGPRCALYRIPGIREIASANGRSVPHIIFQATVWIVLTILVAVLAMAPYWDAEAAFQAHPVGQQIASPTGHTSLFTTAPSVLSHRSYACQASPNQSACPEPKRRIEVAINIVGWIINALFEALSWKTTVRLPLLSYNHTVCSENNCICTGIRDSCPLYRLGVVSEHQDLATAHNTCYHAHRRRASGRVVGGEAPELDIVLWKKNVRIFAVQTKRVVIDLSWMQLGVVYLRPVHHCARMYTRQTSQESRLSQMLYGQSDRYIPGYRDGSSGYCANIDRTSFS